MDRGQVSVGSDHSEIDYNSLKCNLRLYIAKKDYFQNVKATKFVGVAPASGRGTSSVSKNSVYTKYNRKGASTLHRLNSTRHHSQF